MGDRARATIKVKVEILDVDSSLFPDMSSTVYFLPTNQSGSESSDRQRLFCDSEAVHTVEKASVVWLLDEENRARRIEVTVGAERDGRVEILSGLSGGERVILDPPAEIAEGMLLRVSDT
jgi:multidrug efflux pump subunit AcrA (membrane-fusion protein)